MDFLVGVPSLVFLLYLFGTMPRTVVALRAPTTLSFRSFYISTWVIVVLELIHYTCVILGLARLEEHTALLLALTAVRFGLLWTEVFVISFLFTGRKAASAARALLFSASVGAVVALLVTSVELYLDLGRPHFRVNGMASIFGATSRAGAFFLVGKTTCKLLMYGVVTSLRWTRWKSVAPTKRKFYRYVGVMLSLQAVLLVGLVLLLCGVEAGDCFRGIYALCYQGFFGVLLYLCFLSRELSVLYERSLGLPDPSTRERFLSTASLGSNSSAWPSVNNSAGVGAASPSGSVQGGRLIFH
jgi:hypothetical protein